MYYHVERRNGYVALDEYAGADSMSAFLRTVDTFKTRKQARLVASELNRKEDRIHQLEYHLQQCQDDLIRE